MIYYIQTSPPSIRRYAEDGTGACWVTSLQKWDKHCAPEETCIRTGDLKMDEASFAGAFPDIPL